VPVTILTLSLQYQPSIFNLKEALLKKKAPHTKSTATSPDIQTTTYPFIQEREIFERLQHMFHAGWDCVACHPLRYHTKEKITIKKAVDPT